MRSYDLRMMQKNTKFRYLQSSQIPVMFYYTNRECHLCERQGSLEVEKLNFLNFPIPAITERIHDREARIRKDMRAPLSASVCHSFTSWMTLGKSIHPSGCSYVKLGVALSNSMIPSSLKVHHLLCFFFSPKRQNPGLPCSDHVTDSHTPQVENQH